MKLATRFSAFFLSALALVLAGFSSTLFFLASRYLNEQLDEHIAAALDTLEGSIDVEPGGLEWEPHERRILIGTEADADSVRWSVLTLDGKLIDQSANGPPPTFADWRPAEWPQDPPDATAFGDAGPWRMGARRLLHEQLLRLGRGQADDDGEENGIEYPAILLLAGLDRGPVTSDLAWLAITLVGISTALWIVCAGLGHWLSRRALAPLTSMARHIGRIRVAEPGRRVPLPGTADELDELAVAFNELLGRVHEAIARRDRFAGDASHQLRTPIAALLTQIEILRRRPRSSEEYLAGLEAMHGDALRMRQIVESLMFLARSDADALPVAMEDIDLADWLPRQLDRWKPHERASDLHLEAASASCRVAAHPGLLGELFDILTDNALKYSRPRQGVTWRLQTEDDCARLIVEDHGAGIDATELEHIFEPFYRSPSMRTENRPGVGLGLTIVARIVRALGASIDVASQRGGGTRFVVTLPRVS